MKGAKKHLSDFNSVLQLNNYPNNIINNPRTYPDDRHNKQAQNENLINSYSYFNIPFINDSINNKIRKTFIREGLNVRLSHKTQSLRGALKNKQGPTQTCHKKDCTMENNLCFRRNVIYEIMCDKCSKKYIGSTIRNLHDRISEHFNRDNSSVKRHMKTCKASPVNMQVKILDYERRKGNLRIREAYFIQKEKPAINSKEESCIDLVLF